MTKPITKYILDLVILSFLVSANTFAQNLNSENSKQSPAKSRKSEKQKNNKSKVPFMIFTEPNLNPINDTQIFKSEPYEETFLEFSLDKTNFQIHRVNDYSPIELFLNGSINSNAAETWILTATTPTPSSNSELAYVGNIFNSSTSDNNNVELTWEISLNGAEFIALNRLEDQSLAFTFPAGPHQFSLRITGLLDYHQPDGYYLLQLTQSIVPQL